MSQKSHVFIRRDSRIPYFRRSIPEALRGQFGRREFICSLRTMDTAEAAKRAGALLAKSEELLRYARRASKADRDGSVELGRIFDRYRDVTCRGGNALASPCSQEELPPLPPGEASPMRSNYPRFRYAFHASMSARLLGRHRARALSAYDAWRQTLAPSDLPAARADLGHREQALIDDIALNNVNNAWKCAMELLELERVDSSLAPMAALRSFVERFRREELELVRIQIARLNGADIPTPQPPSGALDEDEWGAIRATWESARLPKPATRYEAKLAVTRLRDSTGDKSPCDLTLADAMLFRATLLRQLSRARAKSSFSLVRSILKTAAAESRVPLNVSLAFESVKIEVSEKAVHSYQPFSVGQLQAFFDAPVHSRGLRPAKGGGDAAFWLPLLAVFEGMRLEEVGSLVCGALSERSGRY